MILTFDDALRRPITFGAAPRRVVSLVPSDTYNVKVLGGRVVGRTRYCTEFPDAAVVGGTKDVDVDAVGRLEPDLILANQEENSQKHLEELAQLGPQVLDASSGLNDFADTAAMIASLDLVISIDSAACHLAGALGIPTWLLLNTAADWRWLQERSDTPWYGSMRLFRQPRAGDWEAVAADVKRALAEVSAQA